MTTFPRLPRTALTLALCTALGLGITGCSSDEEKPADPATAAPAVTAPPLPKEPTFAKTPAGAVGDVKVVSCGLEQGEQTAKLELTNSAKAKRDYSIMVIWLKNDSGTPRGSGLVKQLDAAPGKKISLTAKAKVVEKSDRCVLKVLAGDVK